MRIAVATVYAIWAGGCMMLAGGCASIGPGPEWGTRATYSPGLAVIKNAAIRAAVDPLTWVPLAGAGLLYATGADDDWSRDVADDRPLFGDDADETSTDLRDLSYAAYVVTALATPAPRAGKGEWLAAKIGGLQVGVATFALDGLASSGIKSMTRRERPDHESDRSFPSGHASQAGAAATLAAGNLEYLDMPTWGRRAAVIGLYGVAGLTGWARIEAEKHYLSDSLAGFALGHYIARFMEEAFLEAGVRGVGVVSVPVQDGVAFRFDVPLARDHSK